MKRLGIRKGGQEGVGLLETLVAVGVLGFVGLAFMSALTGSFRGTEITDEQVSAENMVRTQLEYIRDQAYFTPPSIPYLIPPGGDPEAYSVPPPGVTLPSGYTITVEIAEYCDGTGPGPGGCYAINEIQLLTASASRGGKLVTKISDLKTKR